MTSWLALGFAAAWALEPGEYALSVEVATDAEVPVVGTKRVRTRSLLHVDLRRVGDGWVQTQRTCAIEVRGGGPAETTMPPAFVAAIPLQDVPVRLYGGRYLADGGPVTVGARPDAPLPRTVDDPNVLDFEGDGKPGATVWVDVPVFGRVDMYVVQRAHSVLDGMVDGNGGVQGQVRMMSMEQRTLDATRRLLVANPPISPVDADSSFSMRPVAAGSDCLAVRAAFDD